MRESHATGGARESRSALLLRLPSRLDDGEFALFQSSSFLSHTTYEMLADISVVEF